ncbi:hypothetical protein [Metamycoplasma hominis]|uniref:hypothetical protein n=1 Tax=Metamycoplasma hominis TaxID=2098 RepID=UPI001E37F2E6|nr:hypothetical protein [Metamycoplasma hominis]
MLQNVIKEFYEDRGIYKLASIEQLKAVEWPTISELIKYMSNYKTLHLNNLEAKEQY